MKRNKTVDLVKAFAIIMMVFGHCIQHGSGAEFNKAEAYYTDNVFEYIYSFHMPLFAFVSGYLFCGSIKKRDIKEMIKNRFTRLCIPILSWQFIIGIVSVIQEGHLWNVLFEYRHIIYNMWFLWAILMCSGVVIIIHYYFKDNIFLYGCVVLCSVFLKPMLLQMWMWLFPFFLSAYFYAQETIDKPNKHHLFIWGGISSYPFILGDLLGKRLLHIYDRDFNIKL